MFLEPKGRDWGAVVNWDDLGKIYAGFIVAWTILLIVGNTWLIVNRARPFIKFRNLPLAVASTTLLHIYLIKICLAYTTNGHFLCSVEFWVMSIYLPLGIALFQAYQVQLRSVWEQQQKLVSAGSDSSYGEKMAGKSLLQCWRSLTSAQKTYCFIALGMFVQVIITAVLFATTPTLQGDWSSFGDIPHKKGQAKCRKSLAWIPSAFWQLFWSWIYGPYTLFKVRNIRDIHLWRAQVIISVISGLLGTPLWLAALYTIQFKPVNRRFVPPMWLAPGIIVMQFVTTFFPIIEAMLAKREMRKTLSILHQWDDHWSTATADQNSLKYSSPKLSADHSIASQSTAATSPTSETRINTMASLRKALVVNPAPLLQFAATKDFSAENILFLTNVLHWRAAWKTAPKIDGEPLPSSINRLFNMAVDIYSKLISDRTADFPINIEAKIRTRLDEIFQSAVPVHGEVTYTNTFSATTPSPDSPKSPSVQVMSLRSIDSDSSNKSLLAWDDKKLSAVTTTTTAIAEPLFESHPCVQPLGDVKGIIRAGFDEHVFDEAEKSIEYLVLTNTWQKFVRDRKAARIDDVI